MRAGTQTVDAQCVIVSVLFVHSLWSITPGAMVFKPEVRHAVSSYHHGALLFVERSLRWFAGYGCRCTGHRVSSCMAKRPHRGGWLWGPSIPLCPDRYVGAEGGLPLCWVPCIDRMISVPSSRGLSTMMMLNGKSVFLASADRMASSMVRARLHGDDDGGFILSLHPFPHIWVQEGIDRFQVSCECFFHFYLYLSVTGIYV